MIIKTKHSMQKMSQRGIHKNLLDIVLIHGIVKKDKIILNKKSCDRFIKKLDKQIGKIKRLGNILHISRLNDYRSTLLKIRDKGGVTLVVMGDTLITSYNTNIKLKRRRRPKRRK
ncbi:hypothetical protein MNB_SV-14-1359 [hydrothermal vent metagenome]|uniref:Uncharacterized protein n=1 Tax=hydrothermal vent metagenome TaxID=652676 RepID=A0A1W1CPJ1_9ZZZZ